MQRNGRCVYPLSNIFIWLRISFGWETRSRFDRFNQRLWTGRLPLLLCLEKWGGLPYEEAVSILIFLFPRVRPVHFLIHCSFIHQPREGAKEDGIINESNSQWAPSCGSIGKSCWFIHTPHAHRDCSVSGVQSVRLANVMSPHSRLQQPPSIICRLYFKSPDVFQQPPSWMNEIEINQINKKWLCPTSIWRVWPKGSLGWRHRYRAWLCGHGCHTWIDSIGLFGEASLQSCSFFWLALLFISI